MYKLIIFLSLFVASETKAEVTLENLTGTWISGCIQTQTNKKSGHVKEIYEFESNAFVFKREWYKDSQCQKISTIDTTKGSFQIGSINNENMMNPPGTYNIEFIFSDTPKTGLVWLDYSATNLRISRDFGNNSLLSLFVYSKQK